MMCQNVVMLMWMLCYFFFKQKTAYEMRMSDWSSDVCSADLITDFRDEAWIFAYVTTGPVSFGKIVARDAEAKMQREFFPHVFPGLSVEPVPPVKDDG